MIGKTAHQHGCDAYLVGGPVRDLFLRKKNLDIDIVVEGSALVLAKVLARQHRAKVTIHPRFGTASVLFADGNKIDLATARKESYPHPGALPVVRDGNIREDLLRRDFSINTLAAALSPSRWGALIDICGGREDLKSKRVRVLHEQSFVDDPTRILRAVRFEQRLGFRMAPKTLFLLKKAIQDGAFKNIKPPRCFEEFKKVLKEQNPQKYLRRLSCLRALDFIENGFTMDAAQLAALPRIEKYSREFGRQFKGERPFCLWLPYFLAMVECFSEDKVKMLCDRFQVSNLERKTILSVLKSEHILKGLSVKKISPSAVYKILKPLSYEVIVFLEAKASKPALKRIKNFLIKYDMQKLAINGRDLQAIGIPPGKQVGEILGALLLAKIDGQPGGRQSELKQAKKIW